MSVVALAALETMTAMPVLPLPDSREMPRKLWTRDEYHRLLELGFIEEGAPYELVEGEIIAKVTQNRPHIISVTYLYNALLQAFGRNRAQCQMPIVLGPTSEPEPDVSVLRGTVADYLARSPGPADVLLAVEVADTTVRTDLNVKSVLYGRAGIPEYWVLILRDRTLVVFREPSPNGYGSQTTLTETDAISPPAAPEARIAVADLLPPAMPAP